MDVARRRMSDAYSVAEARVVINDWLEAYDTSRPHRGR